MRIMLMLAGGLSIFLGLFAGYSDSAQAPPEIAFPDNYAETYTNYLSLDRTMNPDQVIRLFANDVAMQGPDADGKLPFGSVLVAEVYKAKKNDKGEILAFSLALIAVLERITCFRWTICKIKFLFIGPGHRIFANFSLL